LEAQLATDLLLSLQQRRLIVFCGAGLSIPDPSNVPGARALAEFCYDLYRNRTGDVPPGECRTNLETLAEYLFSKGLQVDFLASIVPWVQFRGIANSGHIAVADFLACKALFCGITTNFDDLIEVAARTVLFDVDFLAAFDEGDATMLRDHAPLLKLHGCITDRYRTLWCKGQLQKKETQTASNQEIRRRIKSGIRWLQGNLANKDLLLIGLWSDWQHINRTLRTIFKIRVPRPARVVVVDILTEPELREKAPDLFRWAESTHFVHVPQSGVEFLNELQLRFSRQFLQSLLASSVADYVAETGNAAAANTSFDTVEEAEDLYALRRDVLGIPRNLPVRELQPSNGAVVSGVAHLMARSKGATIDGSEYLVKVDDADKRVRIITGHGRSLSAVMKDFLKEPPRGNAEDYVICAGARENPGKPDIMRDRSVRTLTRSGLSGEWITLEEARRRDIL
jgi:SIR2-like domain